MYSRFCETFCCKASEMSSAKSVFSWVQENNEAYKVNYEYPGWRLAHWTYDNAFDVKTENKVSSLDIGSSAIGVLASACKCCDHCVVRELYFSRKENSKRKFVF